MADKNGKNPKNSSGAFYVDATCIGCEACVDEAPENFALDDSNLAYVCKQPAGPDEKKACQSAMEDCPVQAIGDDA